MILPKSEYPRPQMVRDLWMNLNGEWDFMLDKENVGLEEKWFENPSFKEKIVVPFVYQSNLSKTETKDPSDWCWYSRKFNIPDKMKGKQILLHFGAVDYEAWVYVNGKMVGSHEGGHTPFCFNITPYLNENAEQVLTLRVYDPLQDITIPRGKQYWRGKSSGIWYTPSSGIWQTVWIEAVDRTHIKKVRFTPDIDKGTIVIEVYVNNPVRSMGLVVDIKFNDDLIINSQNMMQGEYISLEFELYNKKIYRSSFHQNGAVWSPSSPNLYDVIISLDAKPSKDQIKSYFGMRKIHVENGKFLLNNRPFYQKLVLDQGYWPDGLLTAPTDDDLKNDIVAAKEMGFNGCRKHQKVEDPRFLYWADKLGFLVWGECAAFQVYSPESAARLTREWIEIVERDYNHPCVIVWTPINESWGVPSINYSKQEQSHSLTLYYLIKSLDPTRLISSNDGWEMTKTDILAIHNYNHGHKSETKKYDVFKHDLKTTDNLLKARPCARNLFVQGFEYEEQSILLTEYGGIAYKKDETAGWGYTTASSPEELLEDYARVMDAIFDSESLQGFCYTQLTDVEQEINGLLTYNREPKCDKEMIRKINRSE